MAVAADVAEAYAEGRVPTNISLITPEYLSESRDAPAIAGILAVFIITSILLAFRFISRIFIVKSFGLDDGIAAISYICYTAFMALGLVLIYAGSGRHISYIEYVLTAPQVNQTEVVDYAAHLIYTFALYLCRMSGLAFFSRLCLAHPTFRISIFVAAGFLTCAFLVQFFLIFAHCTPITGLWPYAWQPTSTDYHCLNWGLVYGTNSGLSLVCDFVLFTIPVAMIGVLRLPKSRKIMLVFVLLPGTLVIGISIARLYFCIVGQWASDGSWFYNPQIAIEVAEIGGTLIALSVPAYKSIISRWYAGVSSTIGESREQDRYGQAGSSNRKSSIPGSWKPPVTPDRVDSKMKTLVQSERNQKHHRHHHHHHHHNHHRHHDSLHPSRECSDEESLYPTSDIHVTTDVEMSSLPRARIADADSMAQI